MAQLTDEQYWKLADSVYDDKTLNINEIKKMSESELNDIESIEEEVIEISEGDLITFYNYEEK